MRILILEDGSWVADELARMLRRQGCAVELARSSEQAVRTAAAQTFDLLILDLSLRVVDGARLLHALEDQRDRLPPLLVLTAREQVGERVQTLELGADCLAEPFAMPELAARVRALIRRSRSREETRRLVHGPLVVDSDARRAYLGGEPLALVPREWAVLEVLLRQAERVVSKESISQSIAGCGKPVSANTIETYVSRLRSKLEPAGIRIRTVHRVGYMLEAAHEFRVAAAS
jgi:two-component system OmpR family response regulator